MRAGDHSARRLGGALVLVVALAAAGCGTGSDLQSSTTSASTQQANAGNPSGKTVSVVMKSLDFSPLGAKAHVGDTVTWLNEDQAPHNVTYVSGPRFRSSQRRMRIGDRFSITLDTAGTIHYVCTLHPWMQATIVVSR
jgi:plastocyanin